MAKTYIFGQYSEVTAAESESFSTINLDARDMARNWKRVSLTSDFIARYYSYFFPYPEKAKDTINREQAENTISFVINELVENTAKYSDSEEAGVQIMILLNNDLLLFVISNYIPALTAYNFIDICREITEGNPEELYIRKLEENAETNKGGSGLGYLTLINDYKLMLGFKFEVIDENKLRVTVQAKMKCKER